MKTFLIKSVMILMIISFEIKAQTGVFIADTNYSGNVLETNFFNDINLANLRSLANYEYKFKNFNVSLSNLYLSNVSKLGQNFFRDYNNFRFILNYSIRDNFEAGAGFQNIFLTDDKNVETNKNNSSYYFSNFNYYLNSSVLLNSKLGIKTEDQIGEYNSGFSGLFKANANNYFLNDYRTSGDLILFYENLIQKQNHNYELNANVYKRFTANADNTGFLRIYNLRNDFFFPASQSISDQYNVKNNIEKRSENYLYIGDNLNYSFSDDIMMSVYGFYVNRLVTKEYKYKPAPEDILFENTYDTKINEDNLELSGILNYNFNKLISQLRLVYTERSENHTLINTEGLNPSQINQLENAEKNKNNNSRRTSAILDLVYLLSNTNSFGITGTSSLLRYDTDFDENYDDRDELESIFSAVHRYNNLINFDVQTRFDFIVSKLSYIFSQRSANNYKNRIYKLSSQSNFSPAEGIITKNSFQVLANYTVYDFEDIISQVQSFSYRQLSLWDSTTCKITNQLSADFRGELKYYEQGQFNNREFSVKPIAYFEEQFFLPGFSFKFNYFLNAGIGYKYFKQDRFQYDNGEKNLVNTFKTFGPVGEINFYFKNNSIVNLTGGYDFIKYSNPFQEDSAVHFQFKINWYM